MQRKRRESLDGPARYAENTNLVRALQAIGFDDRFVHDAFNIFMCTGYDDNHRLLYLAPEAVKEDYVELNKGGSAPSPDHGRLWLRIA
jgi:uncharacterized protein YcgI (DUF1989 family)